jgi:hypothetical protein
VRATVPATQPRCAVDHPRRPQGSAPKRPNTSEKARKADSTSHVAERRLADRFTNPFRAERPPKLRELRWTGFHGDWFRWVAGSFGW